MMAASLPPRVIGAVLGLITAITGQCPDWKTGPGCAYDCHCVDIDQCSGGYLCGACAVGWRGSTCQQENIAKEKITDSSSHHISNGPEKAVNGKIEQGPDLHLLGFHTYEVDLSAWWSVDLGDVRYVQEVVIYFRPDITKRRRGLEFYQSKTSIDGRSRPSRDDACYIVQGSINGTDIDDVLNIPQCGGQFQYLMIYSDTSNEGSAVVVFDFLEVEVYGCSKGTYGEDCSQFCHQCDSAGCDVTGICIAGCQAPNLFGVTCTQTCDYCDRSGCGGTGVCRVGCAGWKKYGDKCEYTCSTCDGSGCDKAGVCHVGCVTSNHYGDRCGYTCDNCDGNGCDNSGVCRTGCAQPNQFGVSCLQICDSCDSNGCYSNGTCRTGCVYKQYGPTCADTCDRCDTSGCYSNGSCRGGCSQPNFYAPSCSQTCSSCDSSGCDKNGLCKGECGLSGQYGGKCDQICDNCGSGGCDKSGTCHGECIRANYYGPSCSQICVNCDSNGCYNNGTCKGGCAVSNRYGDRCSNTCYNCDTSGCNSTGICRDGCAQLKQYGDTCSNTCDKCDSHGCGRTGVCRGGCAVTGSYGQRCTETCNSCNIHSCHMNGSCISDGVSGGMAPSDGLTSTIVAGVIGAVVVLVLVGVVLLVLFRTGRLNWSRKTDTKRPMEMSGVVNGGAAPPIRGQEQVPVDPNTDNTRVPSNYERLGIRVEENRDDYHVIGEHSYENV